MTGAQHYKEAERLLAHAREPGVNPVPQAQVHAILALAAATALDGDDRAFAEWAEVAQP